jgi:hypothetical protein
MTATTADRRFASRETSEGAFFVEDIATCWAILGYELVPDEEWEETVLSTPEVQDALEQAIRDFEEWKNSL